MQRKPVPPRGGMHSEIGGEEEEAWRQLLMVSVR